jgi:hypothetical protein
MKRADRLTEIGAIGAALRVIALELTQIAVTPPTQQTVDKLNLLAVEIEKLTTRVEAVVTAVQQEVTSTHE